MMAYRGDELLPIGYLAKRTGMTVSALRFYESSGLIKPERNAGGQRRYRRSDIRRVSFILTVKRLGFTLSEIRRQLETLPHSRTPTRSDWHQLAHQFSAEIEARINVLEALKEKLDGCIGCGCLSLSKCQLYNPGDRAFESGSGPRYIGLQE